MKTIRRDEIGVRDEVERDEHGHRLIDCVACDRKRTPEGAFGLCYTCYRREKRAQKRKTHMHAQGQRKEQIRLTKMYSQMMTAAISLGMEEDDIRQLQMLLQPYLQMVPRLLNTADISFLFEKDLEEPDSVNRSQAAA
jgi:predicted amidophosphoribosyltransferase